MYSLCTLLASFFVFSAFILELWVLIGQLSAKPFIKWLNFGQASNSQQTYNFGLWNYCNEVGGEVQNCQHPVPAYNWATAPGINQALPGQASSSSTSRTFMALFCLYFIGTGFSFLLWLASLSVCCVRRRVCGISMGWLIFINFLVMLAALICALVVTLRGIHLLSGANQGWSGHAGYSMWMTIGAVVALFLAWLCYIIGSCFCTPTRRDTRRNRVGDYEANNKKYGNTSSQMSATGGDYGRDGGDGGDGYAQQNNYPQSQTPRLLQSYQQPQQQQQQPMQQAMHNAPQSYDNPTMGQPPAQQSYT